MFLTLRPPNGFVQSYDLLSWQAWSLELAVVRMGTQVTPTVGIAVALRGPMNGAPLLVPLVVLDLKKGDDELPEIKHLATIQWGGADATARKARLREFLKVLNNNASLKAIEVEEIITNAGALIDAATEFVSGLYGYGSQGESLGPVAQGNQLGWNWALTRTRFEPLVDDALRSDGEPKPMSVVTLDGNDKVIKNQPSPDTQTKKKK